MIGYSKVDQLGTVKPSQTHKNQQANKTLDAIYTEKGKIDLCEARVARDCLKEAKMSYGEKLKMTYAHKEKRIFYKQSDNHQKLLASYDHTLRVCIPCHIVMEASAPLTKKLFKKLRGV